MKSYILGCVLNLVLTFALLFLIGGKVFSLFPQVIIFLLCGLAIARQLPFNKVLFALCLIVTSQVTFMALTGGMSAQAFVFFAELVAVGAFAIFGGLALGEKLYSLNKSKHSDAENGAGV